jgi:hypothetical protein
MPQLTLDGSVSDLFDDEEEVLPYRRIVVSDYRTLNEFRDGDSN